jgi:hypothetical protein
MLRVRLNHNKDQDRQERVRALVLLQVPYEAYTHRGASAAGARAAQGAGGPKMTLQQLSTQMSLSRGAL